MELWKGSLKETSLKEDEWQKKSWRQLNIVSPTSLTNVTLLVAPLSNEFLVSFLLSHVNRIGVEMIAQMAATSVISCKCL